jgi:predicted transcriptional regulator
MTENPKRTSTGRVLSDDEIDRIADEVARNDADTDELLTRKRGRPLAGSAPGEVVAVRMEPKLREAVQAFANSRSQSVSAVVRDALTELLAAEDQSSNAR